MKFDTIIDKTAKKNEIHAKIQAKELAAEKTEISIKDLITFTTIDGTPQPFKVEQADVDVLAESISKYGQLTPITVRRVKGKKNKYEILSGHKRYTAMLQNGAKTIAAKIIECSDDDAYYIVCNANIQRGKPKPSEVNAMYHYYKDTLGDDKSVRELSAMFGVGTKTLYRCIHLDNLIPDLVAMVDNDKISTMCIEVIDELNEQMQSVLADYITIELADTDDEDKRKALMLPKAKKIVKMADEGIEFTVENIIDYLKPKPKESAEPNKRYSTEYFNVLASENPDRYEDMDEQELNELIKTLLEQHFSDTF